MMTIFGLRRIQAQCLVQTRTYSSTTTRRSWVDYHKRVQLRVRMRVVDCVWLRATTFTFFYLVGTMYCFVAYLYHSCLALPLEFWMYSQGHTASHIHDEGQPPKLRAFQGTQNGREVVPQG